MLVRYILISFLCSLLFGYSLFVARRPAGFVASSRSLTRSKPALSVLAFFLKVMFRPQAGFSAGVNVFTSHKAEAAVKTHHFDGKTVLVQFAGTSRARSGNPVENALR